MPALSPTGSITLDDADFPLVEASLKDGHRDQDFEWLLGRFERLFARQLRYALLIDATALTQSISPTGRRLVIDWQLANLKQTGRWNVGTSVVITSGLIRGALTAMNWFVQQPVPMNYPPTQVQGLDWCVARMDDEGIAVPSSIRMRQVHGLGGPPLRRRG